LDTADGKKMRARLEFSYQSQAGFQALAKMAASA
jgi:hypothetical protein